MENKPVVSCVLNQNRSIVTTHEGMRKIPVDEGVHAPSGVTHFCSEKGATDGSVEPGRITAAMGSPVRRGGWLEGRIIRAGDGFAVGVTTFDTTFAGITIDAMMTRLAKTIHLIGQTTLETTTNATDLLRI